MRCPSATAQLCLAALVFLGHCAPSARAEGAGSALSDVGQCARLLNELKNARTGVILNTTTLIVRFNDTLYGPNNTRFVFPSAPLGDAEYGEDAEAEELLAEANATAFSEAMNSTGPQLNTTQITEAVAALEEADIAQVELLLHGEDGTESEVAAEESIAISSDDAPAEGEDAALPGDPSENVILLSEEFTVAWSNETFEGLMAHEMWGETAESLAAELQRRLLPLSCSNYDIMPTLENSEQQNDTFVTTTTDDKGVEVTVTCVTQVESLANQRLRVHVIGDETEAYITPDGTLAGYVGEVFQRILQIVPNVTYDYRNLTLDALAEFPLSPWSACVHEIGQGRLDLCIGEFYDTPERRLVTEFSGLIQLKSVMLVAPANNGSLDFGRLLRPFTTELWIGILVVMFVFAVLLWLFSFKRGSNDFVPSFSECKRFGHSVHLSVQSLLGAAMATDLSEPIPSLYWVGTGYALFIVVVVAAYTANLAAILAVSRNASMFKNLEDIARQGYPVCVQNSLVDSTRVVAPKGLKIVATDSVETSLESIDKGLCVAAVIQNDALYFQ